MHDTHRILGTVSLFHLFNDGAISVIPLLFPIFKIIFDLSYTQIGIITSAGLAISLISQLLIGRISDKKNYRELLLVGILLLSVSMLFFTTVQGFLSVLLAMFVLRFSSSFFHPLGIGLISRTFKNRNLDSAMGIQSAFGDLGAFLAVLTTLYIAELNGWQFPFFIWAVLGVLILLMGIVLTRKTDETLFRYNHQTNQKQTISEAYHEWKKIMKNMLLFVPLFIISGAIWGVTVSYLPLYLDETTDLFLPTIGLIVSLWIGTGTIISFLYGRIQQVVGRRKLLTISYLLTGISSLLLITFSSIPLIISMVFLLGFSSFLTFPALFSFISEMTHESVEGKTFGYTFTLQLGGGTAFLFFSGIVADILGIWVPFALLGVSGLLASMLLLATMDTKMLKNQ
ncbi:MAG: MFS transporter [Candidatus Thermoplasmatota archaeon]|nr:MFS transporter [Candidatus Thermoplasmatota archaeon]